MIYDDMELHPEIYIQIIQKLKTLTTIDECKSFNAEFLKYESMLHPKEVTRIKEEILTQMIKIKQGNM